MASGRLASCVLRCYKALEEVPMQKWSLADYLERRVVLDTGGTMLYIGRLAHFDEHGFWLLDADVHDRSDGHSSKEQYVNEAHELARGGSFRVNRRKVYVDRRSVIGVSLLEDVVVEEHEFTDEGRMLES